jgi:hypothetical protein
MTSTKNNNPQLSNPASTGGIGTHFENRVQASFVVLMLTGGFAPCLPAWPITKIKLQGKYQGYATDDLIVFSKQPGNDKEAKLLGQIKHSISITNNEEFQKAIQSAWSDFNNLTVFNEGLDTIALLCGPLSATDTDDVRTLLRQAEHAEDEADFIKRISLAKFTSEKQREKLEVFRSCLKSANGDVDLTDNQLWRFLKSFRLLFYDLDIKGIVLSLLQSLIGQYSQVNANDLWTRLIDLTTWKNENAGVISLESMPDDIRSGFTKKTVETIPSSFTQSPAPDKKTDWNQAQYASELAIVNLLGAWSEKSSEDKEIVQKIAQENFGAWISKMREILQQPYSPIHLKNRIWDVTERLELWQTLGPRLFDDQLDIFKQCAVAVLSERDPKFDLKSDERFAASIHGKVLKHSQQLREGLAEGLALLGSYPKALNNCSSGKPETIAVLTIREIFEKADWVLWGSLHSLLPIFAEAAPNTFLEAVESALQRKPCPFDELFSQEGDGVTGQNYLTGVLWALETLAWDEQYLTRVCVILGELASHDPGGKWANRPDNSLVAILLPWLPQTIASIEKRKIALQTLRKENPEIAWRVLLKLLPNQEQISSGSHKPSWRKMIPEGWDKTVSHKEYWEQVSFYAEMAVDMAKNEIVRLNELIPHLDHLTADSFRKMLEHLSSDEITGKPESQRLHAWEKLLEFVSRHRRFADAKWAIGIDAVNKIEDVANKVAPKSPLYLYRRLFSSRPFDLYEEIENWQERQEKLAQSRQKAINEILDFAGMEAVIEFAETVESPVDAGFSLGSIAKPEVDRTILPDMLKAENKNLSQLAGGFVWARYRRWGWAWVDKVDMTGWTTSQIGQFLVYLPFASEAWERSVKLLGQSESEYWTIVNVNPYQAEGDLYLAIDKLIQHGRAYSAINCLDRMLHEKKQLDTPQVVKALLAAASSTESAHSVHGYDLAELIKALQNDPKANSDDLFHIEWVYLPLLNEHNGATPKHLETRLASEPQFFCEVIRLIYRSDKTQKSEKQPTKQEQAMAQNAYHLLRAWRIPPGLQTDGGFDGNHFKQWLKSTKELCLESGHLEVAFSHIGNVLVHCPPDSDGLWIHRTVAEVLNGKDVEKMRNGFQMGVYNSRGVHWVDSTAKPELELAANYRQKAEAIENAGYQRFAVTLRGLVDSYMREAQRIIEDCDE